VSVSSRIILSAGVKCQPSAVSVGPAKK